jgi:hypothetical protein
MGAAFGYFVTTDPLNPAQAVANSLPQGTTPSASLSATSYDTVTITFAEVSTATGGVEIPASDYVLQRYASTGGPPVTVNASCSGTGTITCTESSVPGGTWQYTDIPTYAANWVGVESAESGPVTVNTTATVSVTYPVDSTSYGADWSAMITGTASPGAGATVKSTGVAIEDTSTTMWWSGKAFAASSQTFVAATGTTTWLLAMPANDLTSGDSYSVIAEATDSAKNVGTSSTVSFTYGTTTTATTPPTVSVIYPVDHTTYGADWTGTITGTASSNSGASTTIASTQVAIEDTTADQWWSGKAFAASSQTFVAATGTTTWLLAMPANDLTSGDSYAVIAQATDSAGNVANSSTVTFTYKTAPPAPPTVSITYPVDNTTYGADWTGTITGTASPGTGATITSTEVAIEDTTADQWWSGSSFSASSQTFVPVSGTTTWYLPLEPDSLTSGDSYSVVAQATDSAKNLGTSPTVSFTYGTTTTATTPPTTSTTTTSTTTPPTTSTTTPPTTSTTTTSLASA